MTCIVTPARCSLLVLQAIQPTSNKLASTSDIIAQVLCQNLCEGLTPGVLIDCEWTIKGTVMVITSKQWFDTPNHQREFSLDFLEDDFCRFSFRLDSLNNRLELWEESDENVAGIYADCLQSALELRSYWIDWGGLPAVSRGFFEAWKLGERSRHVLQALPLVRKQHRRLERTLLRWELYQARANDELESEDSEEALHNELFH